MWCVCRFVTRANISWMSLTEISNPQNLMLFLATSANLSASLVTIPKVELTNRLTPMALKVSFKNVK